MRFKGILDRNAENSNGPLFDEAFLRRLERLSFRTAPFLRGLLGGERRSRNLRQAFDFSDHRPYAGGDDLRHVDWNVYGRHEELFVKLGEAPQSVNVHILLDRSPSMAWVQPSGNGSRGKSRALSVKWDAARRLAAALGYMGLVGGERITITPFAAGPEQGFGPTRGKRQVVSALQYLTALEPDRSSRGAASANGLARNLSEYARFHPEGGLLVLISDLLDQNDPLLNWSGGTASNGGSGLAAGLRHLTAPRWQVLIMHVLSKHEVHPTLEGDIDLLDVETGERLPFRLDEETLAMYRGRVSGWCGELKSTCAQRGATYGRILAEWPFERAVVPYLRQRGAVQ
jgi:uncharacterized protein (DUF58 family)